VQVAVGHELGDEEDVARLKASSQEQHHVRVPQLTSRSAANVSQASKRHD
jgi:hypothetical protein